MANGVALVLEIKLICHLSFTFVVTQNGIFKAGEFLFLLISAGLFILFYFLDTCQKQSIRCSFLLQIVETLCSSIGNPNCLGGRNDILGPKALLGMDNWLMCWCLWWWWVSNGEWTLSTQAVYNSQFSSHPVWLITAGLQGNGADSRDHAPLPLRKSAPQASLLSWEYNTNWGWRSKREKGAP